MAGKLNLSRLNKKKEEVSEIEMTEVKAGIQRHQDIQVALAGGGRCECNPIEIFDSMFDVIVLYPEPCGCGSVFTIFGIWF